MQRLGAALPLALLALAAPPAPRAVRIAVRAQSQPAPAPASFEVTLNRTAARIHRALTPDDPQMLLLVLDLTGDLGSVEPAKEALIAGLEKLPKQTYAALLRAQDTLTVLADPGPDRAQAIDAVRNLTVTGRPGLLETLEPVERMAGAIARKSQVRVGILFVTDSDVREYREDFTNPVINSSDPHDLSRRFPESLIQEKISKLQHNFASRETPFHIVHLNNRGDRLNEAYQNGLKQIAESVSGTATFCRSRAEIPIAIESALATVAGEYSLLVSVPQSKSGSLQIQVTAGDAPLAYRTRLELKEK